MLDRLLETGPREKKTAWGGVASVVVHSAIIVIAVYSTAVAEDHPRIIYDPIMTRIIPQPPTEPTPSRRSAPAGREGASPYDVPRIPTVAPSVDVHVPPPESHINAASAHDSLLADFSGGGASGGAVLDGARGFANEAVLDSPVRVLTERTPLYPEMLRAAGIAGIVRVQFVVDTAGRAELTSVRVLDSSHELFTRAVLASLRQARFTPGELSGHRVRTLVERSYRFDMASAR